MAIRRVEKGKAGDEPGALDVVYRQTLPGNRPIVRTNKDEKMEDFVGYMD